jgi:hypothetical protein
VETPEKKSFNAATPEFIHNNERSFIGISDAEGINRCFFFSKNSIHIFLICCDVNFSIY